jgi:CHAD domain-containing protein
MFDSVTPLTLFQAQVRTLRFHLPGVLEGQETSIHDARIATRRLRELIPLIGGPSDVEMIASRLRKLGRSFGRVRDADAHMAMLASIETRLSQPAPSLVVMRQGLEQKRQEVMRRLIKRLERFDVVKLIPLLDEQTARWGWTSRVGRPWRRPLQATLVERARAAAEAIQHATGVYFPHRTHSVRIAVKKLRYAMEIAHHLGIGDRAAALRDLRKTQDLLGELHDRQQLLDHLTAFCSQLSALSGDAGSLTLEASTLQPEPGSSSPGAGTATPDAELIRQFIAAECREPYMRYLARRARLLEICSEAPRNVGMWTPSRPAITLGALAVALGVYVARESRRR